MSKKTKITIGILIIIVIILILIKFLQSKTPVPGTSTLLPSPTPTPIREDVLKEQEQIRTAYYPLINKTPYRTTLFEVAYTGQLKLTVTMFDKDQNKIKNAVYKWITENGVDPNTHQIEFVKPIPPTLGP